MSRSGSTGGSDGDNLMRGRQVTPSGVVPPPLEEDVISSPNILMPVSIASGSVSGVGDLGMLGPPLPSLGQFSVPPRQDFDQSRACVAPGFGNVNVSVSRDVRNVAPSPSPSFNPTSLLFPFSDSGFASLPASVPSSSSSLAFSLALLLLLPFLPSLLLLLFLFSLLDFSLYFPYPFVPLISPNFLLVSTSLVLYWGQLVRLSFGD